MMVYVNKWLKPLGPRHTQVERNAQKQRIKSHLWSVLLINVWTGVRAGQFYLYIAFLNTETTLQHPEMRENSQDQMLNMKVLYTQILGINAIDNLQLSELL